MSNINSGANKGQGQQGGGNTKSPSSTASTQESVKQSVHNILNPKK